MAKQIPYEAFLKLETGTHSARINQLLVTPDGKSLITAGGDKTIRVWDIESKKQTGMLLGQIGSGPNGSIQAIALSPNGKYVVALVWMYPEGSLKDKDRETDVRLFELATGNLQAEFRFPGTLQDLDFSPDGRHLAIVGNPKPAPRSGHVYIYETKQILKGFGKAPPPVAFDVVYDNDTLIPSYVRFIPEIKRKTREAHIVVATWIHHKWQEPEYTGMLKWYSYTLGGELKNTSNQETRDQKTNEQISPQSLAVSREYVILTAHHGSPKKFFCYDHSGNPVAEIQSETGMAQPAFSRDERHLIVGQRGDSAVVQVKVYAVSFGAFQLESTYYGHDSEAVAVALLDEGTAASAGGDQNAIHFWSMANMEGGKVSEISGAGRVIHAVGINSSEQIGIGNHDGVRYEDGRIVLQRLFDLRSMMLRASTLQEEETYHRSQTKFGTNELKWMKPNQWTNLYLLPDGARPDDKPFRGIPFTGVEPVGWYYPTTFGFTDLGTVVTGADDGKIRVTPPGPKGMQEVPSRVLIGHSARVIDHAACGRWLVSAGADQIIRLWFMDDVTENVRTDLYPALNLFVGMDDEWVIWSKSGYYNASQRGDRRFGYHINRGSTMESLYFPSDRFIKSFFRPDIIRGILETGSEERALANLKTRGVSVEPVDVSRVLPPIVELNRNGISMERNKVTFKFSVEVLNPEQPVTRVWIVQNDQFAGLANKRGKTYVASLPLVPGRNRFKILAETEKTKSMPHIQTIMGPEPKPGRLSKTRTGILDDASASRGGKEPAGEKTILESQEMGNLYLLAVGVAEFSDMKSGVKLLEFADDDALSVYNAFGKADLTEKSDAKSRSESIRTTLKNRAFASVEAVILTNEFAKKDAIVKEVDRLCTEIRARANAKKPKRDVLLVFLSGHGVRLVDETTKDLYFWNYDAVFDDLERTGLSFIELGKKITSIPADVILATDACHSGLAGRDLARGLDANELAKLIYAINERGMYIMNAARGEEEAQEHRKIKHGVFTRSILDALLEESEPDMSMMRLIDGVQRHVRKWAGEKQTPVFRMYGDLLPLTIFSK
ncbi:MAG TPA: caspase family protein [Anaerolineales bacterium]|nr:caspase family protein [Anaerolineales bacterium]